MNVEAEETVWEAKLDNRFECKVVRKVAHMGLLTVVDTKAEATIYSEMVAISYDAQFGVDALDVGKWQAVISDFIDHEYEYK